MASEQSFLGISKRADNLTEKPLNKALETEIIPQLHSGSFLPSALTLKEFKEHNKDFWALELEKKRHEHKLNPNDRADMVNWMIEVIAIFECKTETFFRAIDIMDQFYAKTKE